MVYVGIVWTLRALIVLACPAAFVVILLHPDLALDATGAASPLVMGSTLVLMKRLGPWHKCPGQHTSRSVLRATICENERRLDNYDGLFKALGVSPSAPAPKRDWGHLRPVPGRSGDSSPGRRVS